MGVYGALIRTVCRDAGKIREDLQSAGKKMINEGSVWCKTMKNEKAFPERKVKHSGIKALKRYAVVFLALILCFVLTACGEEKAPAAQPTAADAAAPTATELLPDTVTPTEEAPVITAVPTESAGAEGEEDPTEAPEPEGKPAELYYFGHASLKIITPEEKVIYVDPFFGNDYEQAADLILQTHGHYDHSALDKVKNRNEGCMVITQSEALSGGTHQSFDLMDVHIEAVEAGNNPNHSLTNCVGYVLTFSDGVKLYLSGDTSQTAQMAELAGEGIDYAFFCCDGVYNMDTAEASECAALVGATHSIPYHMVPSDNAAGFDAGVAERFTAEGRIILAPGECLRMTKD